MLEKAPIIGRKSVSTVIYTTGKYKFLFLLPKVNKHDSGFRFR